MREVFDGGCQCGYCRYRVRGKSLSLFACHCRECQKQSGSAFGMALWITSSQIELCSGTLSSWTRKTPSGRRMICEFCPECGTRLFHRQENRPDMISIKPGTLDDTSSLAPVAHIWLDSAQRWSRASDECLQYPGNPEDFAPLLARWDERREAEGLEISPEKA
ncbi:GFA family protein [Pararhizobium sp. LjRoot238]|uniref:GFA family protein n=1 Tax=Pararhizobium sp. LjRoot238 TaxID=3342293 RepID=UPI003ECEC8AD